MERYLGFFINIDPTGDGLAKEILDYFDKYGIQYDDLEIVGMDGTTVNTGYKVSKFPSLNNYHLLNRSACDHVT